MGGVEFTHLPRHYGLAGYGACVLGEAPSGRSTCRSGRLFVHGEAGMPGLSAVAPLDHDPDLVVPSLHCLDLENLGLPRSLRRLKVFLLAVRICARLGFAVAALGGRLGCCRCCGRRVCSCFAFDASCRRVATQPFRGRALAFCLEFGLAADLSEVGVELVQAAGPVLCK